MAIFSPLFRCHLHPQDVLPTSLSHLLYSHLLNFLFLHVRHWHVFPTWIVSNGMSNNNTRERRWEKKTKKNSPKGNIPITSSKSLHQSWYIMSSILILSHSLLLCFTWNLKPLFTHFLFLLVFFFSFSSSISIFFFHFSLHSFGLVFPGKVVNEHADSHFTQTHFHLHLVN